MGARLAMGSWHRVSDCARHNVSLGALGRVTETFGRPSDATLYPWHRLTTPFEQVAGSTSAQVVGAGTLACRPHRLMADCSAHGHREVIRQELVPAARRVPAGESNWTRTW